MSQHAIADPPLTRALHRVLALTFAAFIGAMLLTNSLSAAWFALEWMLLPVAVLVGINNLWRVGLQEVRRLAGNAVLWCSAAYLAVLVAATAFSPHTPAGSVGEMTNWAAWRAAMLALFLVVAAYLVGRQARFLERFLLTLVLAIALYAAINVVLFFAQAPELGADQPRLSAGFGTPEHVNATHVGPLCALGLAVGLGLLASHPLPALGRCLVGAGIPIMGIAVLLTQSRGSLLAAVVGALAAGLAASRRWKVAMLVVVAVGITALFVFGPTRDAILARGDSFRVDLALAYLRIGMTDPLLGYGLVPELPVTLRDVTFHQPHNAVVWAFVRGGLGAALLALLIFWFSTWSALRYLLRHHDSAPLAMVAVAGMTSVTEIGLLVIDPTWIWLMFWLPIGLAAGLELRDGDPVQTLPPSSPLLGRCPGEA